MTPNQSRAYAHYGDMLTNLRAHNTAAALTAELVEEGAITARLAAEVRRLEFDNKLLRDALAESIGEDGVRQSLGEDFMEDDRC